MPSVDRLTLQRILSAGRAAGGEDAPVLPDAQRCRIEALARVWHWGAHVDATLPVRLARRTRLEDLSIFGFSVLTAPTLWAALESAVRLYPLVTDRGVWNIEARDHLVHINWAPCPGFSIPSADAAALLQFAGCLAHSAESGPRLIAIDMAQPGAGGPSSFLDAPINYAASRYALTYTRVGFETYPKNRSPEMHDYFLAQGTVQLEQIQQYDQISWRVRNELHRQRAPIDAVARRLGMSRRTLQRRLRAEGTSFLQLTDVDSQQRARELVGAAQLSMTEIALELGFSDSTAFSRAYRRWFGRTPSEERANFKT